MNGNEKNNHSNFKIHRGGIAQEIMYSRGKKMYRKKRHNIISVTLHKMGRFFTDLYGFDEKLFWSFPVPAC